MNQSIIQVVNQIQSAQNQLNQMLSDLNKQLLESIDSENRKNVTMLNDYCFIVPYSKLNPACWSPDYYSPVSQVDAVRHVLNKSFQFDDICKAVRDMITTKKVKISGNHIVHLNDTTLSILENSELGQFVMSQSTASKTD